MSATIPIIDLSLLQGTEMQKEEFYENLRYAAREIGFFYLVGHEVDWNVCEKLYKLSKQFFALPLEEKLKIEMIHSPHFRGYTRVGAEYTLGSPDWREEIDLGAERKALNDTNLPAYMRMQGPNQWLESFLEIKPIFYEWQMQVKQMGLNLLKAFSFALYGKYDIFDDLFGDFPQEHVKLIRYPGKSNNNEGFSVQNQGVGAHKDGGFLTFLMLDDVPGLQVKLDSKEWIDVKKKDKAFVINIGELLELATNGYLKATTHRVYSPQQGQERISIALFLGAQLDKKVPIFTLPTHLAKQVRGIDQDPTNPLIREVGWNYLKRQLRSHLKVAQNYYSDVFDPSNKHNPVKII